MRVRYTSGSNREGRRHAQLRVHLRWITALRRALTVFGRPASRLRPVGVRPSRGTPACGLGLTGKERWECMASRKAIDGGFRRANLNITHCTRYNGEAYSHT